jgi:dihydroneopterin aldolase
VRDMILVRDLRVWSHVGVLEEERRLGQWFAISFAIAADLSATARTDDLEGGFDYGLGIAALQRQSRTLRCLTLEHACESMLATLESLYGPVGLWLEIRKCRVPVAGFDGTVAVRRRRRWPGGDPTADGPGG